ncbi:hypothetical protein IV203_006996 [Nitzschia inconspicua]|uniref:Glycosyltransferase family 8 protein n=1 Tax=Nitzschia inconspicua TaxID=303405 RepID=A0A9K3KEN5_9STRA|nr:hypothetical protein IV203_006996 [Nitzschia inconspicua]
MRSTSTTPSLLTNNRRRKRGGSDNRLISIQSLVLYGLVAILVLYTMGFWIIVRKEKGENRTEVVRDEYDHVAANHLGADEQERERAPIRVDHDGKPVGVTIGWAVTITGCGSDPITEGAAVLKHSIHLTSIHGNMGGRYDYKMYAIYHPEGIKCAKTLEDLGFTLVERETFVKVEDIKGEFLRSKIHANGCCGERELVKLEAYTLTDHPVVVHMDLDTVVLNPMDELFDWMTAQPSDTPYDASGIALQWPDKEIPKKVNAFFTRDYNMVPPTREVKPVQGGFLVLRPDMAVYNELREIVREGNFQEGKGWGGVGGLFYGAMTFQGIIPYYYDILHPGEAVELSRCVYNQMADNPKDKKTVDDVPQGRCRTNEEECEDCRNRSIEEIATAHFTLCQKPWLCLPQDHDIIQQRLCRKLHHEWHRIRADLEESWGRSKMGSGPFHQDHFFGHCNRYGQSGYIPIEEPYGMASK